MLKSIYMKAIVCDLTSIVIVYYYIQI